MCKSKDKHRKWLAKEKKMLDMWCLLHPSHWISEATHAPEMLTCTYLKYFWGSWKFAMNLLNKFILNSVRDFSGSLSSTHTFSNTNIMTPHSEITMSLSCDSKVFMPETDTRKGSYVQLVVCCVIYKPCSLTWSICGHRSIQGIVTFDLQNIILAPYSIMPFEYSLNTAQFAYAHFFF